MSRGACTFRQSDLTKALKAAQAAGIKIARYEVDRDGKIVVISGKPDTDTAQDTANNDFGDD